MKKKILIIVSILLAVGAIAAMTYASLTINTRNKNEDKYLVELTLDELKEKVNNKDSFVLVFTQTTCGHCADYKPKLKHILAENNLYGYEITIDKLSTKERGELKEIANTEGNGTPTTVFIKDGVEERIGTRIIGNQTESKIIEKLRQTGFIE